MKCGEPPKHHQFTLSTTWKYHSIIPQTTKKKTRHRTNPTFCTNQTHISIYMCIFSRNSFSSLLSIFCHNPTENLIPHTHTYTYLHIYIHLFHIPHVFHISFFFVCIKFPLFLGFVSLIHLLPPPFHCTHHRSDDSSRRQPILRVAYSAKKKKIV